jgi:hypothetical protein
LPQQPIFAALIRTTGARNELLLDALESVELQSQPCLAIVAVHAQESIWSEVRALCPSANVLHAPNEDPARRRGYPVNVGIDHCLEQHPEIECVFLLDDDDIIYPFFTSMMTATFEATGADLVYASANCRESGKPLAPAYPIKPFYHLFDRNFIPSNSYAIRTSFLKRSAVRMDEDLDSLEDWLFLLRLIEHGCRFAPLDATLSEFRSDAPAESAHRYNLEQWNASAERIRAYINSTNFQISGAELSTLAERNQNPTQDETRFADSSTTAALHRRIWDLEHSLSWKSTAPLRKVASNLMRLKKPRT